MDPKMYFTFESIVLPQICEDMPKCNLSSKHWVYEKNLASADPHLHEPVQLRRCLADLLPHILESGRLFGSADQSVAINTVFQWNLLGKVGAGYQPKTSLNLLVCSCMHASVEYSIKRFSEL